MPALGCILGTLVGLSSGPVISVRVTSLVLLTKAFWVENPSIRVRVRVRVRRLFG